MATRLFSASAVFATALLGAGLLAGCSDSDTPTRDASSHRSTSPSASSPPGATASSGGSAASGDAAASSGAARPRNPGATGEAAVPPLSAGPGEIVVTGDVEDGVEPGCVVLRASGGTYVLVGGDRQRLAEGGRMTVRGRAETGMMTTCQQGTPLRVVEIQPR